MLQMSLLIYSQMSSFGEKVERMCVVQHKIVPTEKVNADDKTGFYLLKLFSLYSFSVA